MKCEKVQCQFPAQHIHTERNAPKIHSTLTLQVQTACWYPRNAAITGQLLVFGTRESYRDTFYYYEVLPPLIKLEWMSCFLRMSKAHCFLTWSWPLVQSLRALLEWQQRFRLLPKFEKIVSRFEKTNFEGSSTVGKKLLNNIENRETFGEEKSPSMCQTHGCLILWNDHSHVNF